MERYSTQHPLTREQFVFRGQAGADWPLRTTLDRYIDTFFIADREVVLNRLLDHFVRESLGLTSAGAAMYSDRRATEFIARHHGLPTAIMDWTKSPYIAAYFALADPIHETKIAPETVAVWAVDLSAFDGLATAEAGVLSELVQIIDDPVIIADNVRAIEQRGVFLRVTENTPPLEKAFGNYISRIDIPAKERSVALSHLDEMGINHRSLFRGLDAAAETSKWRVSIIEGRMP